MLLMHVVDCSLCSYIARIYKHTAVYLASFFVVVILPINNALQMQTFVAVYSLFAYFEVQWHPGKVLLFNYLGFLYKRTDFHFSDHHISHQCNDTILLSPQVLPLSKLGGFFRTQTNV